MLESLKAKFTRAKVNHPRKLGWGSLASLNTMGACMLPLDGGATLLCTGLITASVSGPAISETLQNLEDYKTKARIHHLGANYPANKAQQRAYQRLESRISTLERKFENAPSNKIRQKFLKKAQKCADKQQWIVDGLKKEALKTTEEPIEFKIQRGPKSNKPPKN